jgi:hypothetical protein
VGPARPMGAVAGEWAAAHGCEEEDADSVDQGGPIDPDLIWPGEH